MAAGEPSGNKRKITLRGVIVTWVLILSVFGFMFWAATHKVPTYRVQWNPVIPKAIVEKWNIYSKRYEELKTFRDRQEAIKYFNDQVEIETMGRKTDAHWKIIRESKIGS